MTALEKIEKLRVSQSASLIEVMKKMDLLDRKSLMVFNELGFLSIVSIGDIQRAILKKISLDTEVKNILRSSIKVGNLDMSREDIRKVMKKYRMELFPILNEQGNLVDIHFWEDIFSENENRIENHLDAPVVIMAGGKGTRLRPLTHIIPKPLIPLGDKSVIENIIDRFSKYGLNEYFLSVNYKADMIKFYFNELKNKSYSIQCIEETKPLGTAGSLSLMKDKIKKTFFVSNCDILIDEDYAQIFKYHKENNFELTIVSAIKNYSIPYGTLDTGNDGVLEAINEKPEYNFQVNTGFYIVEPHLLKEVPENKFFHITHLMEKLISQKRKVGVFPVSEGSWIDIGQWEEYSKANIKLGYNNSFTPR